MPYSNNQGWSLSPADQAKYTSLFQQNVLPQQDKLSSNQAREIFMQSKLDPAELFSIWNLVDPAQTGCLKVEQFSAAMHLIFGRLSGRPLPSSLPPELQSLISGGSASNAYQSNPSNVHQNKQFTTPTSGRSFDSGSSAFPVSFPGSQPQPGYNTQQSEFDFTKLKALETEAEKKRTLVANIPPPLQAISDQEINTLKSHIKKIYQIVPFHHPNFFTYIFEKSTTTGDSRSVDLAGSLKSEIDKLVKESLDSTLIELTDKIHQCQNELFKLEDSELYGYSLPTNNPAPILPQIDSSGDAIAQKAAAMLAQRMQQLNLAAPVQTIPPDAQNRIQEKEAQLKKEYEDRKTRINQLSTSLAKHRKDFDELAASLSKSNSQPSDLKRIASEWQSGSQRSSYKVGRFVEELSGLGKSLHFPPEVKSTLLRELPPPHSQNLPDIKTTLENSNEPMSLVGSTKKTKDLIEQFRNTESINDPFSSLVSEKEKETSERDRFFQIILDKEKRTPEMDLFSQIVHEKEKVKNQPMKFFEDSPTPDSTKQQSDSNSLKNTFENEVALVNSGPSSIPPPPPLPNLSAAISSKSSAPSSKFDKLESKNSAEKNFDNLFESDMVSESINRSASSKQFSEEMPSSNEESTPRATFSDNNPFARLNTASNPTLDQPSQATQANKSFSNNNPFGKPIENNLPSLPPGVKFSVSAIYAYEEPDASITFQPGDILYITDDGDDPDGEWYFGYVKNQPELEDWFPRSFVVSLGEGPSPSPSPSPRPKSPEPVIQPEPVSFEPEGPAEPEDVMIEHNPPSNSWRVIYDFVPEDSENTGPIIADSIVVLLDQTDPDWWLIEDPRADSPPESQVYVPANFLEAVA